MLGVEGYGSDNDSDAGSPPPAQPTPAPAKSVAAPFKRPKKIQIGLPSLPADRPDDPDHDLPPAKKPRIDPSATKGRSSLLSMLPAPKQAASVVSKQERVLGGGTRPGLVFDAPRPVPAPSAPEPPEDAEALGCDDDADKPFLVPGPESDSSSLAALLPPSLKKGRANVSLDEPRSTARSAPAPLKVSAAPAVDFFSLGSSSSSSPSIPTSSTTTSTVPSIIQTLSSAPKIEEFKPPEPTPTDPYQGYYQLPSGAWAMHDPTYYATFQKKWQKEYDAHVRALEKGKVKGFEALDEANLEEVDVEGEAARARLEAKAREERKELTMGAKKEGELAAPRMNIQGAKLGGRARSRHQLSTLLTEAYSNREALEEKIAEGRRNRKEAGNKYGF